MLEWLAMGGYALYVWPSFGLGALVVAWNLIALRVQRRQVAEAVADGIEDER